MAEKNEIGGKTPFLQNLQLSTLENTRESYERIIKGYAEGMISEANLRALVYALTGYLSYFKLLQDMDFEKRLEEIEEAIREGNIPKTA